MNKDRVVEPGSNGKVIGRMGYVELIFLFAYLASIVGASIDVLLPAYQPISLEFGGLSEVDLQKIILIFIAGMFVGEILSGYIADIVGRKTTLLCSMAIFSSATILCFYSASYEALLAGRFMQGIGAAGQKISTRAVIRDLFSGSEMARLSSFVMATLIFIPFVAPFLGQQASDSVGWRYIFVGLLAISMMGMLWAGFRLPETLNPALKNRMGLRPLGRVFQSFVINNKAMGYTIIAGMMFGVHLSFLSLAPLFFRDIFGIEDKFPVYFGFIACLFGIALFMNGRIVVSLGPVRMATAALIMLVCVGIASVVAIRMPIEDIHFEVFMVLMALTLSAIGILFGNIIALAMEPCRAVAGYGASISSGISTLVALGVSQLVGNLYDGTEYGFFVVTTLCSGVSLIIMLWVSKSELVPIKY